MPCYFPLKGWRSIKLNQSGKRGIVFNKSDGYNDMPVSVPCGRCIGCRLERSRQWAMRCLHEASLRKYNSYITLTFNDENINKNKSIQLRDIQLFMKKMRKRYGKMRFFACGEYGENTRRPHYHVLIFGFDFKDKKFHTKSKGHNLYTSKSLNKIWPYGFALIGDVTFESAAYVARYIVKKALGPNIPKNCYVDIETGEMIEGLEPEFVTMSKKPGIGMKWLRRFRQEVYDNGDDFVVINGKKMKPPKYYDKMLEVVDKELSEKIKAKRRIAQEENKEDNTDSRLAVKEFVTRQNMAARKKRSYENGDDS